MGWFNNLSFRWKISIPVSIMLLLLILVGVNGLLIQSKLAANSRQLGNVYLAAMDLLLQADRDMYQAQTAERGLIFLEASHPNYHELQAVLSENQQQALERAQKASRLSPAIAQLAPADKLAALHARWSSAVSNLLIARRASFANDPQLVEASFGDIQTKFSVLRNLLDRAGEAHQAAAADFIEQAHSDQQIASRNTNLALFSGGALGLLILLFLPPLLTRTLIEINRTMADIADGEGDLTSRTRIDSRDELGSLSRSFNTFMDTLQKTIGSAKTDTDKVRLAATEMTALGETNLSAMSSQNRAINAAVSAVNELSLTVNEIAKNTNITADQARTANTLTQQGNDKVSHTMRQISVLAKEVQATSDLIGDVQQQASEANSVLDVIRGIAEQTNLLALNAAIEAARAGEQGRGFAVVADEVRTLASKTQDSTQHIQQMLGALQQGVESAVRAMRDAADKALSAVDSANATNEALTAIDDAVAQITQMSIQIATSAEEQSVVIGEVNTNLSEIDQQSKDTTSRISLAAQAGRNMETLTAGLQQLMSRFRC